MAAYIILDNSDSSLTKKFRVLKEGFAERVSKITTQRIAVTGHLDNQVGPAKRSWSMSLYVYGTDPTDPTGADGDTEGYGTLSHLETFYGYDTPSATPSNVITMTYFDDTTYDVYFVGEFVKAPMGSEITGINALYNIRVELIETT